MGTRLELTIIALSLLCVVATYTYASLREGSFVNIFTPTLAVVVPADYLLEAYNLTLHGPSGSVFAHVLMYGCHAASFAAFTFAYLWSSTPTLRLPFTAPLGAGSRFAPYLVLLAAIALYSPVLIEFRDVISTPRRIYELTRTGYGLYFFLSTTLTYLALILMLFQRRRGWIEPTLFTATCLVFLWLHGNKGPMLMLIFVLSTYWVYVLGKRISVLVFAVCGTVLGAFGLALFLLTNPALILEHQGLEGLAKYSDTSRNGMLVIDSDISPLYGKLTLEDELYSRIPRPLMPDKPNDFGSIYLAEHFYPTEFLLGQGAPAFSFGAVLADFGVLALPIVFVASLLSGFLLKMFMTGFRRYRDPGSFTLVLFAAGLTLIPVSTKFVLPEAIVAAIAVNIFHYLRLGPHRMPQLAQ